MCGLERIRFPISPVGSTQPIANCTLLHRMPEFRGFVDQAGRIRQRDASGRVVARSGAPVPPSAAAASAASGPGDQKDGAHAQHRRASSGSSVSSLFSSLGTELQNKFNLLALQFQSKSSKANPSDGDESENYSLLSDGSDEDISTGSAKAKSTSSSSANQWGDGEMIELSPTKGSGSAAAAAARRFSGTTGYEKSSPLLGNEEDEDEDAVEHHFDAAFGAGDGVQLATFSPPKQR